MEITIDGQKRGALSYAFARALDGTGLNGDVTREKLFKFMHQQVLQRTQHQQRPVLEPRTADTAKRVLFRKPGSAPGFFDPSVGNGAGRMRAMNGALTRLERCEKKKP